MKKVLGLFILLSLFLPSAHAQSASADVDSTLYYYYRRCNNHITQPWVMQTADTLYRLSVEKNDVRMQAVSYSIKADHYYFTNNLDSLKAWIPRVQRFARDHDQLKYYYFTWTRLILYYTKHSQYTTAQYEIDKFLKQAEKDDFKPAVAQAYTQLGHIYHTKVLLNTSAKYYRKAAEYIEENKLDGFHLSTIYNQLASDLSTSGHYEEALEALKKAEKHLVVAEQQWETKYREAILYAKLGDQKKAAELLHEAQTGCGESIPQTRQLEFSAVYYLNTHQYAKSLDYYDRMEAIELAMGHPETSYFHIRSNQARLNYYLGNYKKAYEQLRKYTDRYQQVVTEESESTLNEFASLLGVEQLNRENAELEQQTQTERLRRTRSVITALVCILLLAGFFIVVLTRLNRRLSHAKRAAEESNRMKGIFIRNVTHEINTPLNAIVGFAELAATCPPDDAERSSYIGIIQENSGYLQKLVDDVLYISDLESSETAPSKAPADIDICCAQSLRNVASERSEGVELRFKPFFGGCTAPISKLYVTKVLTELLRNALRFTKKGVVELAYERSEDRRSLVFKITDTGCGIPAPEHERIFERFIKLDPFGQGMGLGLFVCRLIAARLGGELKLDASYTEGARFIFTLPAE